MVSNEQRAAIAVGVIPVKWSSAFGGQRYSGNQALEQTLGQRTEQWAADYGGELLAMGQAGSILVAASDSSSYAKSKADFICDGVRDNATIQEAVNALAGAPGLISLSPGEYQFAEGADYTEEVTLSSRQVVCGAGDATHIIQPANGDTANRAFRVAGTNLLTDPIIGAGVANMRFTHLGRSSPLYYFHAVRCFARNITSEGAGPLNYPIGTAKEMNVSAVFVRNCLFEMLRATAQDDDTSQPGCWNALNVSRSYGCWIRGVEAHRTRSAIDCWAIRSFQIADVDAEYCDEGMDLANISDCHVTRFEIRNTYDNAITLKAEGGTQPVGGPPPVPDPWDDAYEYGQRRNTFSHFRIDQYGINGIGYSTEATNPEQEFGENTWSDGVIVNSQTRNAGSPIHAAIRYGREGSTNLFTPGEVLRNIKIRCSGADGGDGISYTFLHRPIFDGVDVEVGAGAIALGNFEATAFASSRNDGWRVTNSRFKKNDATVSLGNVTAQLENFTNGVFTNVVFEGAFIGLDLANLARCQFVNVLVRENQGYGIRLRPAISKDLSTGGRLGLVLTNVAVENSNLSNSSRAAVFVQHDGGWARAGIADIKFIGLDVADSQGTPTGLDLAFDLTGGATAEYVKRVVNSVYDGTTPTVPAGTGNEVI